MADYGFLAYNRNNHVVIDSLFKNYAYKTHGTANVVTGLNYVSIPNTTNKVVFAIRPPTNAYIAYWGLKMTVTEITHGRLWSSGNTTVDWILFEEVPVTPPPTNSYGMVIYNASGEPVFSSLEKYMNFVDKYKSDNPITPFDIDNNYFTMLSSKRKVEYRYKQTGDEGTLQVVNPCSNSYFVYTAHAAIVYNYKYAYVKGMRKNGSQIDFDWVLMSDGYLKIPNVMIGPEVLLNCSGVPTVYTYKDYDSNASASVSTNTIEVCEFSDPLS